MSDIPIGAVRGAMLEACLPLGDKIYSGTLKREAVMMVLGGEMSLNKTTVLLNAKYKTKITRATVNRWVSGTETRLEKASNFLNQYIAGRLDTVTGEADNKDE